MPPFNKTNLGQVYTPDVLPDSSMQPQQWVDFGQENQPIDLMPAGNAFKQRFMQKPTGHAAPELGTMEHAAPITDTATKPKSL